MHDIESSKDSALTDELLTKAPAPAGTHKRPAAHSQAEVEGLLLRLHYGLRRRRSVIIGARARVSITRRVTQLLSLASRLTAAWWSSAVQAGGGRSAQPAAARQCLSRTPRSAGRP